MRRPFAFWRGTLRRASIRQAIAAWRPAGASSLAKSDPMPSDDPPSEPTLRQSADAVWLTKVFKGPDAPQLTVRAVLTGGLIGAVMSVANVYTLLKVGIASGVALTACVLSFALWNLLRASSGGRLRPMSILENNCMQTTAGAAGFSTGPAVAVTFASLMMVDPGHRHQPWWIMAAFAFCTAIMGVLLAVPLKHRLINEERLPFPTGTAAATTLENLYSQGRDAAHSFYLLMAAMASGILVAVLSTAESALSGLGRFFAWARANLFDVHLPEQIPAQGFALLDGKPMLGFGFEPSLTTIGFGMIVGARVAFSMLASALLLSLFVAPALQALDASHAGAAGYVASLPLVRGGTAFQPLRWSLWGGASLLVFSELTALSLQWKTIARAFRSLLASWHDGRTGSDPAMANVEVPLSWVFLGLVPIGLALMALQVFAFRISWVMGIATFVLSFVTALVVARAAGETDLAPVGALGKIVQVVYALLTPASLASGSVGVSQSVVTAGIATRGSVSSSELLSDLKTGYLLGAHPRKQFLAQLYGVAFGTLVAVPAWYLMIPDMAALEAFPAPASQVWIATARALAGGLQSLPITVLYAVVGGALAGILLPLASRLVPRLKPWLPSATGLSLGWVLPFSVPLSFAIGASLAWIWKRRGAGSYERHGPTLAAGWIAGEAVARAILAMLVSAVAFA